MREIAENFVAAVLTALIVSFMTLSIPKHMLITIITLITFIPSKYLVDKIVLHVKTKTMPTAYQWVRYIAVLVAAAFMVVAFVFENTACAVVMILALVVAIIAKILEAKLLAKKRATENVTMKDAE